MTSKNRMSAILVLKESWKEIKPGRKASTGSWGIFNPGGVSTVFLDIINSGYTCFGLEVSH